MEGCAALVIYKTEYIELKSNRKRFTVHYGSENKYGAKLI